MQAFDIPFCRQHPQLLANYYYLEQPARRVCVLCKVPSSSFLFTTSALTNLMKTSALGVTEGEESALSRHQALTILSERVRGEYGKEDQELIREMMKRIQQENKKYREVRIRIDLIKSRLGGLQKLMKYFDSLKEGELYAIKMNLSSEEGMKKFYKKCRNYAALINKGVHNQFKKLQSKLQQDCSLLTKLQEQSLLHRLQGIIDKRNSQLARRQNPSNQKDPKIQLKS